MAQRLTAIANTRVLYASTASALTDASGNSYTLTASGSAAYENGFNGATNTAFNLDGTWFPYRTGDLGLTNTSNISVQFDVKISTAPSSATFALFTLVTNDAVNSRRAIHVTYVDTAGAKKLNFRHGGSNTDYTVTLTAGSWYRIGLVIDYTNSLAKGYLNENEVVNTAIATANSGNAIGIQIGADAAGSAIPNGTNRGDFTIDNFRVTSTARTYQQIANDYDYFFPDPSIETTSVDGWTGNDTDGSWSTIRGAATGTDVGDADASSSNGTFLQGAAANWGFIGRAFFLFDTSAIPDTDVIDSGTLSLVATAIQNTFFDQKLNICATTPASNTAITTADYDQVGSTAFSTQIELESLDVGGTNYNAFALNASGLSNITNTGVSKFGARLSGDLTNTEPVLAIGNSSVTLIYADTAGTTKDPKLVVVHSAAAATRSIESDVVLFN